MKDSVSVDENTNLRIINSGNVLSGLKFKIIVANKVHKTKKFHSGNQMTIMQGKNIIKRKALH